MLLEIITELCICPGFPTGTVCNLKTSFVLRVGPRSKVILSPSKMRSFIPRQLFEIRSCRKYLDRDTGDIWWQCHSRVTPELSAFLTGPWQVPSHWKSWNHSSQGKGTHVLPQLDLFGLPWGTHNVPWGLIPTSQKLLSNMHPKVPYAIKFYPSLHLKRVFCKAPALQFLVHIQ